MLSCAALLRIQLLFSRSAKMLPHTVHIIGTGFSTT